MISASALIALPLIPLVGLAVAGLPSAGKDRWSANDDDPDPRD